MCFSIWKSVRSVLRSRQVDGDVDDDDNIFARFLVDVVVVGGAG